jgi:arabinose-5-phosphate isomerase
MSDAPNIDLKNARKVLEMEADGLRALAMTLGEAFVQALDLFSDVSGRVVVSGMGKSGHIGHKIAATLASTGTPAFFVHPGEASHGDLGMITHDDAVLALSNSGETNELADLVAHCKRFDIPLISITSRANSALSRAATASLVLPDSPEACPMGLAPTTSTTLTLALGDALAVALLERKGFSSADFHVLHPGGKLGRKLLKVSDLMHSGDELPSVTEDMNMSDVILEITAKRFGCAAVVTDNHQLQGVITDGDLRRHMDKDILNRTAASVMTTTAKTIGPDALASEAVALMNNNAITSLFVVNDTRVCGIIHVHDCLNAGVA